MVETIILRNSFLTIQGFLIGSVFCSRENMTIAKIAKAMKDRPKQNINLAVKKLITQL